MASINLDEIQTKPVITAADTLNIEVIQGKFKLSYRTEINKMSGFFMSNTQMDKYIKDVASWTLALERWVFGDGVDYLGFATKDILDNNYLYLSESNYYYKRLLTDEVMEALCEEYAKKEAVSALVDNCLEYGQNRATALANALAAAAGIMKSQAIMNDTNIQTTYITAEAISEAAQVMSEALFSAAAAGGDAGDAGGGGGGTSSTSTSSGTGTGTGTGTSSTQYVWKVKYKSGSKVTSFRVGHNGGGDPAYHALSAAKTFAATDEAGADAYVNQIKMSNTSLKWEYRTKTIQTAPSR